MADDRFVDRQRSNRICNDRDNRSANHDLTTRQRIHNHSVLVSLLISSRRNSQCRQCIAFHQLIVIVVPLIGVFKICRLSNSVEGNCTTFADSRRTINSNSDFRIRNHNNVSVIRDNRDTTRHFKYYDSIVSMCCAISQTRLLVIGWHMSTRDNTTIHHPWIDRSTILAIIVSDSEVNISVGANHRMIYSNDRSCRNRMNNNSSFIDIVTLRVGLEYLHTNSGRFGQSSRVTESSSTRDVVVIMSCYSVINITATR